MPFQRFGLAFHGSERIGVDQSCTGCAHAEWSIPSPRPRGSAPWPCQMRLAIQGLATETGSRVGEWFSVQSTGTNTSQLIYENKTKIP